ncbi:hypothetical protein JRQ81_019591 [Phrynocephalus forsythii]|uniref:TATA box-binding protein-associated factor RNA polymerase I subunit D n=1 Tax=Phrynocephalus forsythii TaxID=171643 RepID=A0A9Q0XM72_9SAUR|nr:hypothetical protein JRQ81_019591 [Phrynocephalus forsythii]
MADASGAETSSSDDGEFRAGAGAHASEDPRKKVNSAGCDEPSAEKSLKGDATAGGSTDAVKSGGPLKFPKPKLDLRALFDYHFRRRHRRKPRRLRERKRTASKQPTKSGKRLRVKLPLEEQRRRYNDRGYQFPFVQKLYRRKDLPLKLVCFYEQGALEGYFRYITMLKYEHHLKKSLTELDAGVELENECLESRKYKYLDDDGPLSPIAETSGEDSGEEDIGVKIVEKSSFILRSTVPKKKKSRKSN